MTIIASYTAIELIGIVTAIGVQVTAVVTAVLAYLKIARVEKVADATHTLVNSNMGVALREKSIYARRVADLTRDDADKKLADEADKLLADHNARQAKVDRGESTPLAAPDPKSGPTP